jgi:hypothetical protein
MAGVFVYHDGVEAFREVCSRPVAENLKTAKTAKTTDDISP